MKGFDPIWLFIEEKLNVEVPSYVKNILHACGFNNGITIASIDDEDIKYFEDETRNGNVVRFFREDVNEDDDEDVDEVDSVLEGQVFPAAKFEFTRGHKKLLLLISKYVKEHMEVKGPNNFILPKKKTAKETTKDTIRKISRKRKVTLDDPLVESALAEFAHIEEHSEELLNEAMKKHKKTLLNKSMIALRANTEKLVAQNVDLIKWKIANDLVMVYIAKDKKWGYAAVIGCPYCDNTTNVFQTSSEAWGTSNFDRHLQLLHPKDKPKDRPSQTVNRDANREIADVTGNTIDNNENDNIETVDEAVKTDDAPPKKKQKKQLKKAFNEENNGTLQTSKEKAILSDKTTKSIADISLKVSDEAVKRSKKEQKKQLKKFNEENNGTSQTSKENAILSVKTTKRIADIPLDVNDEAVETDAMPSKKKQKQQLKIALNEENSTLHTSKEKPILSVKTAKSIADITLKVSDEAVKRAKKEQKKQLKKFNEENNGTSQTSKENAILSDKTTKSIADIPLKVSDEAVKRSKKEQKKQLKKFNEENNGTSQTSKENAILSVKTTKRIADIPLDVNDEAVETDAMPSKKKPKQQLKIALNEGNSGTLQTSKEKPILSVKATKSITDIPLKVNDEAVKIHAIPPKKEQKKQLKKPFNAVGADSEDDGVQQEQEIQTEILTASSSVIVNHSKRHEADEKKCVKRTAKRKAKVSQNSQKQREKQLEKNWRKYW